MKAADKIDLYDLQYRLLTTSEDGHALFESNVFGCWFAKENPDIYRYLASQLDDLYSIEVVEESPFSIFLQQDQVVIQSIERTQNG